MFFVHTSLVLMMSLQRERLDGPKLFFNFYIRRFFRIYPLSIACVLIVFVTHYHYSPAGGIVYWLWTRRELFANVLLVQNLMRVHSMFTVMWTLPLEVQMYVFLPFLFLLARSCRMRTLYFLWCGAVVLAAIQPHVSDRLDLLSYVPCFVPGVIAWAISSRVHPRLPGFLWPLTLFTMSLASLFYLRNRLYVAWAFCLLLGLAIPQFSEIRSARIKAASKTIAKYSYGIYLSHVFALSLGFALFRNHVAQWSIFLFLAFLLPYAMYHLIEHPGIRLGKLVAKKLCQPGRKVQDSKRSPEETVDSAAGIVDNPPAAAAIGVGDSEALGS